MANKIDLLKITEPTIVSSDTDVFYIRRIGENDYYDVDDMLISILHNLNFERTPVNSYLNERKPLAQGSWRGLNSNYTVLSDILDSEIACKYFRKTDFFDVTESYLAFKFGYVSNIEQIDALWDLAGRYGYELILDERNMLNENSLRAFYSTGSKIVFSDTLGPDNTVGRQQINFPAIKLYDDDIG